MKSTVNTEIKRVVGKVKDAQQQLQSLINNQDWVEDARKYAERQGKEVKKLFKADASKVKSFLEKERKELAKFQKQIPGEVKKLRSYVLAQRKEFAKLLANVSKANAGAKSKTKTKAKAKKPTVTKKKATKKAVSA